MCLGVWAPLNWIEAIIICRQTLVKDFYFCLYHELMVYMTVNMSELMLSLVLNEPHN